MAKKNKRLAALQIDQNPEAQRDWIAHSVDTIERHTIQCCICDFEDLIDSVSQEEFVRELFDSGWRYGESEKFGVMGVMCPKCAVTPDAQRGED